MITSINEYKVTKFFSLIKEGTYNYWPGTADDSTADYMGGELMIELSKIVNQRLYSLHADYMKKDNDCPQFWANHGWTNIVLTCLQYGFYIDSAILYKVQAYIQYNLDHIDEGDWKDDERSKIMYIDTMTCILKYLDPEETYNPGFLDETSTERQALAKKNNEM